MQLDRSSILHPKPRSRQQNTPVRFITTYDPAHAKIREILKANWPILLTDNDIKDEIGVYPSITFRRGRSLRDRLTSSILMPIKSRPFFHSSTIGCYRCSGCIACPFIQVGGTFTSHTTGQTYEIKGHTFCLTRGVIYLASCRCGLQYVGKTHREFRRRIGDHLGDIRNKRDTAISRHIRTMHDGDPRFISFQAIEHVSRGMRGGDWDRRILQRESFWIFELRTLCPQGLNEELSFNCFL